MNNYDLKEGLVCYWQDGGWHGVVQIIKWNKRYVHFKIVQNKCYKNKLSKTALSKFLDEHEIYEHRCEYGSYHKNIGEVIS